MQAGSQDFGWMLIGRKLRGTHGGMSLVMFLWMDVYFILVHKFLRYAWLKPFFKIYRSALEGRRTRPRLSSPPRSPVPSTSSALTAAEVVERYSGLGISGHRRIPVSEAVSHEYRVPEEVRVLGYEVITLYVVLCITHKEDRSPQLESCWDG